jgi:hypothetical protein
MSDDFFRGGELASLRRANERLQRQLMERDLVDMRREVAEIEAREQIAKELAAAKVRDEAEAELEEHRKRAWENDHHRVCGDLLMAGDIPGYKKLFDNPEPIPPSGWPEGVNEADYRTVPAWAPPEEPESPVASTLLGKALAAAMPLKAI